MSDRLAVMNGGHVEQVGAPQDVDQDPETLFVADFLGVSNLMDAHARQLGAERMQGGGRRRRVETRGTDLGLRGVARIVIRPERVGLEEHGAPSGPNRIPGMVERVVYVGSAVQVIVRAATGESLQALVQNTGLGIPGSRGHRCNSTCRPMRSASCPRASEAATP